MRGFVAILLILIYLSVIVAQGDVDIPVTGGARVSSSSGGGSRSPDIDNFIRQVESWKTNYPDRFDYLKKLLYKEPFTNATYSPPGVWLYYPSKNKTVSRYDPIEIGALVMDTNPIEIRRALFLTLEIQEPGESSFKPAKAATQIIQVNEYDDKEKTALRIFPDLSSFDYLRRVGAVKLRVSATDGQYKYDSSIQTNDSENLKKGYYSELLINVYNIPPEINNTTMGVSPNIAKWDDYIQYTASLEDQSKSQNKAPIAGKEENPVQVTLHIYNGSDDVFNITKPFLPTDMISFSTKDANIFKERDAGKNFTYRYSCSDDIEGGNNTTWTKFGAGPYIRPNPKIKVTDLNVTGEDENCYWWQSYNFGLKAKSQSTEPVNLKIDLYTDTIAHPGKLIASQTILVPTNDSIDVNFKGTQPFDVADCNNTFRYYFRYSAPDQDGKTQSNSMLGPKVINSKLVRYSIYSWEMILNLLLIVVLPMFSGILLERRLLRKGGR